MCVYFCLQLPLAIVINVKQVVSKSDGKSKQSNTISTTNKDKSARHKTYNVQVPSVQIWRGMSKWLLINCVN